MRLPNSSWRWRRPATKFVRGRAERGPVQFARDRLALMRGSSAASRRLRHLERIVGRLPRRARPLPDVARAPRRRRQSVEVAPR